MMHGPLANPSLPLRQPQIHLLSCFETCPQLEGGLLHTFYTSIVNSICLKNEHPSLTLTKAIYYTQPIIVNGLQVTFVAHAPHVVCIGPGPIER